ncbi:hypothetical protein QN277_022416 [Acacia crassicarpa]|uniref:Uncharacterized protein n=1 Tax=Acacia crassicarpa TaxID=499986 RepID=A0AAE1MLU8_9FABA|nr:hypothetical protein QN277_022416 [Acacia crassicarpa]
MAKRGGDSRIGFTGMTSGVTPHKPAYHTASRASRQTGAAPATSKARSGRPGDHRFRRQRDSPASDLVVDAAAVTEIDDVNQLLEIFLREIFRDVSEEFTAFNILMTRKIFPSVAITSFSSTMCGCRTNHIIDISRLICFISFSFPFSSFSFLITLIATLSLVSRFLP